MFFLTYTYNTIYLSVYDKNRKEITLIETNIRNLDSLITKYHMKHRSEVQTHFQKYIQSLYHREYNSFDFSIRDKRKVDAGK